MPRRDHIIYSHPARADGFAYFYIGYRPGHSDLFLKFRRVGEEDGNHLEMSVADMLKFLADKNDNPGPRWPAEVVERAFMTLRIQIQRWQDDGGMAAG